MNPTETTTERTTIEKEQPPEMTPRPSTIRMVLTLLIPALILGVIALTVSSNGDTILTGFGHNPPAADELVVERVEFHPGKIELHVINPQTDAIAPAIVLVDSAMVNSFTVNGDVHVGGSHAIGSHDRSTLSFDYPWIEDDPYLISIVSTSGVPTEVEVPAAVPAQKLSTKSFGWGAVLGILVGFVPVALGLLWLPALRHLSQNALAGFLAFTAGLLLFLAIEAGAEGLEMQSALIPAFGGAGVVAMGIVVSMAALALTGRLLRKGAETGARRSGAATAALSGTALAWLVAIGIGLHNLGEGLAIGSSFASGASSLAISLVIGFMIHNVTEGIGIAAPIARSGDRLGIARGVALAAIAGLPAVLGIWAGRHIADPLFATLCFALAAGAALQVVIEIVRSLRNGEVGLGATSVQVGFAAGVLAMWATGILAG